MKQIAYLWSGIVICAVVIVVVLFKINSLENKVRLLGMTNGSALSTVQNSVQLAQADAKAAKELAPGLGEFMTTIQLHAGKLWFAAQAANWDLAKYELDELKETMEAAKGLNEEKNGVKISNVLDSVLQTQVAGLEKPWRAKAKAHLKILRRNAQRMQRMPHGSRLQVYPYRTAGCSTRDQSKMVNFL